jgi:hypothetical protein
MLHLALFCLLVVGQVPPPPLPHPPGIQPAEQPPADAKAQREWLLAHFLVDMEMRGIFDAKKYQDIEQMVNKMTPPQLGKLVRYYQQRKAEVEASEARAEAHLRSLEEYRDFLKRELETRIRARQQAVAQFGPAIVPLQVYALPVYVYPPYYASPHHHHH